MKNKKWSLSQLSFLNTVFTTLIISIAFMCVSIYSYNKYYDKKMQDIKKSYITKNKVLLKEEVRLKVEQINNMFEDLNYSLVSILDNRIETIKNIYLSNKNIHLGLNKNKLIPHFINTINLLSYKSTRGYVYIFDKSGKILYHHTNKKLEGKNFFKSTLFDTDVVTLITKSINEGEANGNYFFTNENGVENRLFSKIKKVDNIYIAASVYIDEIENELKKSILNRIKHQRFGTDDYGYFWITNNKDEKVFHPYQSEILEGNITNIKTKNGIYIFKEMNKLFKNKDEIYMEYDWEIPNTEKYDKKISFVKKVGIWNWRIGAGFYFEDLKKFLQSEEEDLKTSFKEAMLYTVAGVIFLSIIILFFAWNISKKFKRVEEDQVKHLNLLEQYKMILDKSTIVSKTNKGGRLTYVNSFFEKVSGFSKDEVIGKSHNIIRHPSTPKEVFEEMWKVINKGDIWQGLLKNRCKEKDKSYYNRVTIVPIKDENNNIIEYISASTDVTEIVEQKDKLENIFVTDSLTSLGSRIKLLNIIAESETTNIIAIIDIDRFTEVNDMYGNKVGDSILKEVANNIYVFSQNYEILVFRIHADVFAVYSEKYDVVDFENIMKKLIKRISTQKYHGKHADVTLSFSVGIASGDCEIMACADMALKSAKKNKETLVVYDENNSMLNEFEGNLIWMKKLNLAIEEKRIVPFYQPIYNLKTQKIEKYEVLMRYIEEDGTEVSPFAFLDIAKKTKIYPRLTKRIVKQAVNFFKNHKEIEFSINLTLEDLLNQDTMGYIYSVVQQHKLFKSLVIEIVESEELVSFEHVEAVLQKFKKKGSKIAIDDFGAGYSNYNYLLKLDVDYIKIDGSIIKNILDNQATEDIVSSIVDFSKKSGIKTIGEFVSNEELSDKIKDLNVDYAQGYFYGKPLKNIV